MQAYWQAKHALFQMPGLRAAVVNVDDPRGAALASELLAATRSEQPAPVVWTYSLRPDTAARLTARDLKATTAGQSCVVEERLSGGERAQARFSVPFVGSYNVANLLGVVASLRALGFSLVEALQACGALAPVPGRLAAVNADAALPASDRLPLVLVDYAHTPDALEQVLLALRPVSQLRGGALHCVVGCGGGRDAGKRPLMAAKAEAGADRVCLTSDNPRSEDPMHILGQMSAGLNDPSTVSIQPDRAQAIAHVIANAAQPDVVLIAGKGHETTQDIQGVKHPFSDHQHALAALQQRWKDVQP
jgi:UDP-N-acetylmuramoyl-L-alanyl-D-glutamate--2,6-diaminopimelate ligase